MRKCARTLTENTRSHWAAVVPASRAPLPIPTLSTSPSSAPMASIEPWTMAAQPASSVTSATTTVAAAPAARTSSAVRSALFSSRSARVSDAPASAQATAIARPLPMGASGSSLDRVPAPTTRIDRPTRALTVSLRAPSRGDAPRPPRFARYREEPAETELLAAAAAAESPGLVLRGRPRGPSARILASASDDDVVDRRDHGRAGVDPFGGQDRHQRGAERLEGLLGLPDIEHVDVVLDLEREVVETSGRCARSGRFQILERLVVGVDRERARREVETSGHRTSFRGPHRCTRADGLGAVRVLARYSHWLTTSNAFCAPDQVR